MLLGEELARGGFMARAGVLELALEDEGLSLRDSVTRRCVEYAHDAAVTRAIEAHERRSRNSAAAREAEAAARRGGR